MSTKKSNTSKSQPRSSKKGSKSIANVKVEEDEVNINSKCLSNAAEKKKQNEIINLEDDVDPLNVSGLIFQKNHKSQTIKQDYIQTEQLKKQNQEDYVNFKSLNAQISAANSAEQKIAKINYFFKWNGEIYFQIMIGKGSFLYRQPQIMTYNRLCQDLEGKQLVYKYIKQRCLAAMMETKDKSGQRSFSFKLPRIHSTIEQMEGDKVSPKKKMTL